MTRPTSVRFPAELAMLLWGRYDGAPVPDLRLPFHPEHRLHREDRIRFFVDSKPWLEFLGTRRFSVGTRIHGTIAGVLGGTPSFLIVHDPRTRELAEYHEIPYRPVQDIEPDSRTEELYHACDYSAFNAGMEKRYEVLYRLPRPPRSRPRRSAGCGRQRLLPRVGGDPEAARGPLTARRAA